MPIDPQIPNMTPLTAEEGARVREFAAGLVAQAENLGVQIGRDPHMTASAVLIRALSEAVCNVATLDASPDHLAQVNGATIQRLMSSVGHVQLERYQAAGIDPPIGEQLDIESFGSMEVSATQSDVLDLNAGAEQRALRLARVWLAVLIEAADIEPDETSITLKVVRPDETPEAKPISTINLGEFLKDLIALTPDIQEPADALS